MKTPFRVGQEIGQKVLKNRLLWPVAAVVLLFGLRVMVEDILKALAK